MPAGVIAATVISTPLGPLSLLAYDGALAGAGFTADPGELHARLHPSLSALPLVAAGLAWAAKPVLDYFGGDLNAMGTLPVRQLSTPGRERLWAALRAVPPGSTVSYAELAARAGSPRAVRAAGAACAVNLVALIVPCHRVLRSDGSLGGYYYGRDRKEWLLRHEGAMPA
jgi:methylated-DNA-[protein]-cysteine S-methyltransferase